MMRVGLVLFVTAVGAATATEDLGAFAVGPALVQADGVVTATEDLGASAAGLALVEVPDAAKVPPPNASDVHRLGCLSVDHICSDLFVEPITTNVGCKLATIGAGVACEAVGFGPTDPLTWVCTGLIGTTIWLACSKTVNAGQDFNKKLCVAACHCGEWFGGEGLVGEGLKEAIVV